MKCEVCQREFHSPCSELVSVCSYCIARGSAPPTAPPEGGDDAKTEPALSKDPSSFVDEKDLADLFPEFEFAKRLGAGGMGVVFRARQKSLDRSVAIKILNPKLLGDPEFEERFEREAKAMAMLGHPNIVSIHDFGVRGGYHFLVMEHVEGRDLQKLIRAGALESALAYSIIRQVCDGLHHAHQKGIVHRDIKPGNILVGSDGVAKISDFGLARIASPTADVSLTMTNAGMGTPAYIAPEQLLDARSCDARSDIFALGVVVYEMLTGSTPSGNFPPPTSRLPRRNRRLDEAILRAMDPDPASRPVDPREISSIIAGSEPLDGADEAGEPRILALSSRAMRGLALALAALALAVAGGVLWTLQEPSEVAEQARAAAESRDSAETIPVEAMLPVAAFPFDPDFEQMRRRGGPLRQWHSSDAPSFLAPADGMEDLVSLVRATCWHHGWLGSRADGRNVSNFPPLNNRSGIVRSSRYFNLRWDRECLHHNHPVLKRAGNAPSRAVDFAQTNNFAVVVTEDKRAVFVGDPSWQPLVSDLEKRLGTVADVVSVDCWGFTFALLRESGEVLAWNLHGGIFPDPENGGPFQQIAAGEAHVVALGRDQKLSAWSRAPFALHEHVQRSLRVPEHEDKIVRIMSVARINAAQREDGSWVAWGGDESGVIEKINTLGPALDLMVFGETRDAGSTLAWIEPREAKEPVDPGRDASSQKATAPPSLEKLLPKTGLRGTDEFERMRRRGGVLRQWSEMPGMVDIKAAAGIDDLVFVKGGPNIVLTWHAARSNGEMVSSQPGLTSRSDYRRLSHSFFIEWPDRLVPSPPHSGTQFLPLLQPTPRAADLAESFGIDLALIATPEGRLAFAASDLWLQSHRYVIDRFDGLQNVVAVGSWGKHYVVLTADGKAHSWAEPHGFFESPEDARKLVQVAAGAQHVIGLYEDGSVVTWCHPNSRHPRIGPPMSVPQDLGPVIRVQSSGFANAVQRPDGSWFAWGDDEGRGLNDRVNSIGPALDLETYRVNTTTGAKLLWIEPRPSDSGAEERSRLEEAGATPSPERLLPKTGLRGTDEFERMRRRGGVLRRWSEMPGMVEIEAASGIDDLVYVESAPNIAMSWYAARRNGEMVSSQPGLGSRSDYRRVSQSFIIEWPDRLVPSSPPSGKEHRPLLQPIPRVSDLTQSDDVALLVTPERRLGFGATESRVKSHRYVLDRLDRLEDVVAVESWISQFAVLTADGKANCWIEPHGFFDPPEDARKLVQIAVGAHHVIGLYEDGSVATWCHPLSLRHPRVASALSVPPDLGPVIRVKSWDFSNAAQRPDGSWLAWGDDEGRGLNDQVNSIGTVLDFETFRVDLSTGAKLIWIEPTRLPDETAGRDFPATTGE